MDYEDDNAYMEAMRQFYEESDKLEQEVINNKVTQRQLQSFRNQCEKEFLQANKIIWKLKNGQWQLHTENIEIHFEI